MLLVNTLQKSGSHNVQENNFFFRPKLTLNGPNDSYEQEADVVADKVMRMPEKSFLPAGNKPFFNPPTDNINKTNTLKEEPLKKENKEETEEPLPEIQAKLSVDGLPSPPGNNKTIVTGFMQRKCAHCEQEKQLQLKDINNEVTDTKQKLTTFQSNDIPQSKAGMLPSAGHPLNAGARYFMEPRFGVDLGDVRVHTDPVAAVSAQALRARAFTLGNDIGFAAGEYHPETRNGRRLLAHELTHTIQTRSDVVRRSAISDDIRTVWGANPNLDALLARLSRADVQGAQSDADIDTEIATLLAGRTNDLWVAQRIRQGRLGTTAGARPVEAHFVQGTSSQRALVIAGVHGSERQGIEVARMLLADLAASQPVYTVIVVPSLFPDNAARRSREGTTPTNRNFPPATEDLAAATTVGSGTAVDASTDRAGGRTRAILPENIMLLQLIERFNPERIISIHGTRHSGAGGVFYDPVRLTTADIARARRDARAMAFMQVPFEQQSTFEGQERLRQAEELNFRSMLVAMQHRDRAPSLAAAAQIDAATTGITGRERRPMKREGETTVSRDERARRRAHPSVPGNVGSSGAIDTAFWSGSTPGGVSLGDYASQRGISVFTVEPPFNLRTADYPSTLDTQVDAAERRVELQAYATAVRTVLLGR